MGKSGMSFSRFKHRIFLPFNALSFMWIFKIIKRFRNNLSMCSSATDISLSSSFSVFTRQVQYNCPSFQLAVFHLNIIVLKFFQMI